MICIHYRVSLNFDHKNNKELKHSDEERRNTERNNENKRKRKRNRDRKRQEEEEEEQRRKVSRGRELKSKTRILQKTNMYDPCTAEFNQCESN